MKQKSGLSAFVLWLFCLFGLCGLHRFYVGRIGTGIVWLLTFGLLGVGQLFDLFFLGSMVRQANLASGLAANTAVASANSNVQNVVNVTVQAPGYAPMPSAGAAVPLEAPQRQPQLETNPPVALVPQESLRRA